jgi:hypothetical protein
MPNSLHAAPLAARNERVAKPTTKALAWPLFDAIVEQAPKKDVNPWQADASFAPDYDTLCRLLGVPLKLKAATTTGVPALALDVWAAYELRRAGLEPDWVWPRAESPRVVSRDLLRFIASVPKKTRADLLARLQRASTNKTTGASASVLGKNYTKQVDVVVSAWETGPEVLISTKRMDSSFGKNAANRIEESYGDAKNLRLRYPQAACGFLFGIRSTAWDEKADPDETGVAERLVDLLAKMGMEPDAYHATCLVVMEYKGEPLKDDGVEDVQTVEPGPIEDEDAELTDIDTDAALGDLPEVRLRQDLVPDAVDPGRFFQVMMNTVLTNTPVNYHRTARLLKVSAAAENRELRDIAVEVIDTVQALPRP